MKEKISSEINSNLNEGVKYATETTKSAVSVFEWAIRSYAGETILERNGGRWVPIKIKPGIRDFVRIRR